MAQRKSEAWLTSVVEDGSVANALVLAESIRRTKTTRTIAAITSRNVTIEKRVALRKAFDVVFCMDESYLPRNGSSREYEDVQAKVFAFSLSFFEKCVFIAADCLVLENADNLFEDKTNFKFLKCSEDDSIDLSLFLFEPSKELWEHLWESTTRNGKIIKETFLSTWLKNQKGALKMEYMPKDTIAKFSATNGTLAIAKTHAPIIHFVDIKTPAYFHQQMEMIIKLGTGLREKTIASTWSELYHKNASVILQNPINAPSVTAFHTKAEVYKNEPIAIVGMSCRYPGANNLEEFWNMLYQGEEGVREPPAFRWTKEHSLRVTQQERRTNAGFLNTKVDEFDSKFFGVSPKEAAYLDPQTRLLHEVLWESLEDSGIDPLSLYGTHTGIFTGSWMNDYRDITQGSSEKDFFRTYMGNSIGAAAARLSFLLGLTGPSVATESGCSSAIVALDLAVKSLRSGETSLALAGGVNLLLHPFTSNIMDYVIAPNGRCKTFDSKADGFGRAEGCGVLVLKRLSDALRDRDNIWAMIRGSAVSQEGLSRSLGTPTVHCEALAMQLALKDANVRPDQVSFVETHGTGTAVGDPMEVAAIAKAYFSQSRSKPLVIGSVKTNVGHTESCSGITGIMKAVLAMQHQLIPKHRNLDSLNPEIFLDSIPAIIPLEPIIWPKLKGAPRFAGVSSFGITGTDGHVIIEEAPDYDLPKFNLGLQRPTHILKISGKTSEALEDLLGDYQQLFEKRADKIDIDSDLGYRNAAYTANVGRAAFNHRAFIVAKDYQEAAKALREKQFLQSDVNDGENHQICFLFTGQGSQYQGMAKLLYETSPIFRIHFDACDRTLREMYNLSIREVLWESDPSSKELSRTIYSQTSIFCVEYCLLKLWESWGIRPDYVLGHSLGEFCAAVAAGVLDFKDALKLVAERSRLIDNLPRGSMLVIKASKPEVEKLMKSAKVNLDFAAVNNPEQTVIAGDTAAIQQFLTYLKSQGQKAIILEATHAFHSRHMDPMLEKYRKIAQTIEYKQGNANVQYVSGMEGRIIGESSELNADYWVRHTREKVSFVDACNALREVGCQNFLEVGPQPVLSSFVMMNNEDVQLNCMPSLRRGTDDWQTILTSLGKLYLLGYKVDWKAYDEPYVRNKVSLPFHPFHRKSFWVECSGSNVAMIHPLIGHHVNNASTLNIFQNDLSVKSVPYVRDHCIGNRIVFPGAGYTEMCLSAGYCVANGLTETLEPLRRPMRLENLRIDAPLELKEEKGCRLQVIVDLPESASCGPQKTEAADNLGFRVKVYHQNTSHEASGKWVLHASSTFIPVATTKDLMKKWKPGRIAEIMSTTVPTSPESFYKRADEVGLRFGESFRKIQRFWTVKQVDAKIDVDEVVTEVAIPPDYQKYLLHPLIIDAIFQSGILTKHRYGDCKLKVPVRIGQLTMFAGIQPEIENGQQSDILYMHAWYEDGKYCAVVSTENYTPIAFVEDVELIDTNVKTIESVLEQQSSSIPDGWEEVWKVIPSPFSTAVNIANMEQVFADPQIQESLRELGQTSVEGVDLYVKEKRLLCLYILNAILELGWKPELNETVNEKSFCSTLKILPVFEKLVRFYFTVLEEESGILVNEKSTHSWKVCHLPPAHEQVKLEISNLADTLKGSKNGMMTRIYEYLSKSLSNILIGQESALTLLFPTEEDKQDYSAEFYYQNHPGKRDMFKTTEVTIKSILKQSHAVNTNDVKKVYRCLEVGSGTGSLSRYLLEWLKEIWGDRFELYYTDISQSFFIKAEKKFEQFSQNIKYTVFNIEESPLSQGIPLNYFDMVAATDVLHATRRLDETLVHLRQTLRPGGVLLFTETIIPATDITFVFGLLEGYWRFEDFQCRPHHCCVGEEVWEQVLLQCGFQSVNSFKGYVDQFSCITAVASPNIKVDALVSPLNSTEEKRKEWVVFADQSNFEVTTTIINMLVASGYKVVTVIGTKDGRTTNGNEMTSKWQDKNISVRVVRADNEDTSEMESLLEGVEGRVQGIIYGWAMDLNETEQRNVALPFMNIAKIIIGQRKPPQLYVLTQGVHAVNEDTITCHPTAATIHGMAKSLKNENADLFIRYVDIEQGSVPADVVDQVLFELAMSKGAKEQQRVQVAYRNGVRHEPRLVKASLQMHNEELKLPPSTDRYHLVLPKTKVIQDLEFDTLEEEQVGEDEIEIKVKAYALNFRDIFAILKPIKEFDSVYSVGFDYAGIVTKIGSSTSKLKVGDRVFGANNFKEDQLPSHLVLESKHVLQIPETMTYWEAATLPAVFSTAFYCLITVAKMTKGDTVLIHTGSGGVGLAAIQLAKHVGANIITTAGNSRKRAYLRSIGIQHVFHSRNTSFEKDILRVTNGRGVDIVLNSITGPGIKEATLNASAKNARFVEMSKLSIWSVEEVKALRPDVDYRIVDLTVVDLDVWENLLTNLQGYLYEGHLKPIPYVKFDALNIRQALQYFQKAKHIGKVVCTMPDVTKQDGQYKVNVPLFSSESTYLITGGLGGIGFEVCKWMLGLGATDIVLTGRNAPKPDIAVQIQELVDKGFNVMVRLGDVGNFELCKEIIEEITHHLKPLRGVMHCAGILKDSLYTNQTWETFQATFTPKVSGTWNLHHLTLDIPLEHFVMFSSVTALVGTPSQANHAAANCFEDALVHYRHSLGLPGTTINWGQWAQVGCAKELNFFGVLPVSVKRMLNGMEMLMRTQKRQFCFSEFDSFNNFAMLCPIMKSYLDERLWKQLTATTQTSHGVKAEKFWLEMDKADTRLEKISVMAIYLKAILRGALRLEPDEPLGDDVDIQELGVDSLMMIELKNNIQSLLGSRVNVTATLLKNCNTIRLIATVLVNKLLEEDEDDDQVPLEPLPPKELTQLLTIDCTLNESIQATSPPRSKPSQIKTVLVTGATGKFAPYLLQWLANTRNSNSVEKVICLIRGLGEDVTSVTEKLKATLKFVGLESAVDMSKIECVPGDIAMENMGLAQTKYDAFCKSVDAVIHCACKSHHSEHYRVAPSGKLKDVRSVNIGGTLNVLKFASTLTTKYVYFPSSFMCGIFGQNEECTLSDDWPKIDIIQTIVDNKLPGLQASKFIIELLLQQANERGIPCKVFRFPWIAGESTTGRLNYLNNLYVLRYLSFLKVKAMPSLAIPANFLPVDMCADLSLKLLFDDDAPFEIFNIGHPQPQVEQEFVQVALEEFGKDIEIMDWQEFINLLEDNEAGIDSLKDLYRDQKLMSMYMADAVGFVQGYLISPDTFFLNKKVAKFIPNYGQAIASSMDIIRKDLQFVKSTGFLHQFGI